MSDVIKDHRDADGNPCTLEHLCRTQPEWAASRIRHERAELARLRGLMAKLEALTNSASDALDVTDGGWEWLQIKCDHSDNIREALLVTTEVK